MMDENVAYFIRKKASAIHVHAECYFIKMFWPSLYHVSRLILVFKALRMHGWSNASLLKLH